MLAAILIFAAAIWGTAAGKLGLMEWKPLLFIGDISYSLYVLHQTVGYFIISNLEQAGLDANLAVLMATLAVVLLAYLVHRVIERPAQRAIRAAYAEGIAREAQRAAARRPGFATELAERR
jgi:peptidoglycan/LPS O-acetylase OafA/YrhL